MASSEPSRRARWLAAGVAVTIAVAVSQTWFRPGRFLAGGDIAPFVRTSFEDELGSVWNHGVSGAGSPSPLVVQGVEVLLIKAVRLLGGSEAAAQRVLYALLLALVAAGAVAFARRFTSSAPAQALAGLFACMNAFVLNVVPNPLVLGTMALLGFTGSLVVGAAQGRRVPAARFAVATVGFSYVLTNPPLFAVAAVWVVVLALLGRALGGPGGTRRAGGLLVRAAPLSVLLNAWWLVPAVLTFVGPGASAVGAVTDVDAWAWTHARASVANVLALNGLWSWAFREYAPFAADLDRAWWSWLSLVPALACLAAPLLARGRAQRRAIVLLSLGLALVFLGKGLHPPLAALNRWAYGHVPGLWLLREPATKASAPLVLVYAALIAVAVAAALRRAGRSARRPLALGAVAVGSVAVLAYPYPLWNGSALAPTRHVEVPEGWRAAASYLNERPARGKALVLPQADYYQVGTTWGYYGTDAVPTLLLRRPTIQLLPEGYFEPDAEFLRSVERVERALAQGRPEPVPALLRSLGVSHVVLRHDLDRSLAGRSLADPSAIGRTLRRVDALDAGTSFGVADVFEVRSPPGELVQLRGGGDGASVRWEAIDPSRYSVEVAGAEGPVVVVLAETYDPGWRLAGLPAGATAQHRRVDGYANGWVVAPGGDVRFTLEYRPARAARAAIGASALTALGIPVAAAGAALRCRRRTRGDAVAASPGAR